MTTKANKPLGGKSYGHIPHLQGSRMGPGDHHCAPGQGAICTAKTRDKHDTVIVLEKLDGSNVGVAMLDGGEIVALGRSGYLASTSKYEQHRLFAAWVRREIARFCTVLCPGERICGEWLAQAHGTRYALRHEPFVAFDLMRGMTRAPWSEVTSRLAGAFILPAQAHVGPIDPAAAMAELGTFGRHGALDPIEGVVYRVERKGEVDFLAKYVRPDKADGCYLPEVSGGIVWNWAMERAA